MGTVLLSSLSGKGTTECQESFSQLKSKRNLPSYADEIIKPLALRNRVFCISTRFQYNMVSKVDYRWLSIKCVNSLHQQTASQSL